MIGLAIGFVCILLGFYNLIILKDITFAFSLLLIGGIFYIGWIINIRIQMLIEGIKELVKTLKSFQNKEVN